MLAPGFATKGRNKGTEVNYNDQEHNMLCDIADWMWNADITHDYLKPEYKELYDRYGKEFWDMVFRDIKAIESQITDYNWRDLLEDYTDEL